MRWQSSRNANERFEQQVEGMAFRKLTYLLPACARRTHAFASSGVVIPKLFNLLEANTGQDAFFANSKAIGVADGVGGWLQIGVDSGRVSRLVVFASRL